jgi:hypothetical protein
MKFLLLFALASLFTCNFKAKNGSFIGFTAVQAESSKKLKNISNEADIVPFLTKLSSSSEAKKAKKTTKVKTQHSRYPAQTVTTNTNTVSNVCSSLTPSRCVPQQNLNCVDYTMQMVIDINSDPQKNASAWAVNIHPNVGSCETHWLINEFAKNRSCTDKFCKSNYVDLLNQDQGRDPCFSLIIDPLLSEGHAMVAVKEKTLSEARYTTDGSPPTTVINGVGLAPGKYIFALREPQSWGTFFDQTKCVWIQADGRPVIPSICRTEMTRYLQELMHIPTTTVTYNIAPENNRPRASSISDGSFVGDVLRGACKKNGYQGF